MIEQDIQDAIGDWLSQNIGVRQVFTITFDSDFVTGNLIDITFGTEDMTQVEFTATHAATMIALARAIYETDAIFKAEVTGAREITCTANVPGVTISLTGPTITGGASQPEATTETTTEAVFVTVVDADQAAPHPTYPYATIKVHSIMSIGDDDDRGVDEDTNLTLMGGQRQATVDVNYYGEKHMERLMAARSSLKKMSVLDSLRAAAGVAIGSRGMVQNLTELMETDYELRSFFDFTIYFSENYEDDVSSIETVSFNGTALQSGSYVTRYYTAALAGTDEYLETAIITDPAADDFTLMVNAYLTEISDDVVIYTQEEDTGSAQVFLGVERQTSTRGTLYSSINGVQNFTDFIVRPNRWVTYVLRYNKDDQILDVFINGSLVNSFTGIVATSATGLHRIGTNKDADGNFLIGNVGPSAFFHRALTDAEISDLSISLTAPKTFSETDFFYAMDQNSDTLEDNLNSNDGQFVNCAFGDAIFNGFTNGPVITSGSTTLV